MRISNYAPLISNLPVRQQCFETKRSNWKKAEKEFSWLNDMNDRLFGVKNSMTISRQDIFNTVNAKQRIVLAVYWGYPRGMRNNYFLSILKNIDLLESTLVKYENSSNLLSKDFTEMCKVFKKIPGLGISTYSKMLYYFNIYFNSHCCLILDSRLIEVFKNKIYSEFIPISKISYTTAEVRYLDYLGLINHTARIMNVDSENIEQFLFIFGKNLAKN
ncbi:hypothetical protein [Persicitalea sp.]|uniref:8-oxoguanine DNA glycosylase OGG fold protein n=1 Tax=Persicitalea sp. TaxID=3100273 RepID=UPI003592F11B